MDALARSLASLIHVPRTPPPTWFASRNSEKLWLQIEKISASYRYAFQFQSTLSSVSISFLLLCCTASWPHLLCFSFSLFATLFVLLLHLKPTFYTFSALRCCWKCIVENENLPAVKTVVCVLHKRAVLFMCLGSSAATWKIENQVRKKRLGVSAVKSPPRATFHLSIAHV